MPRVRRRIDRDTKISEILEAAVRRLRAGGYEALSVAAISRELGVAQNAIYWYFPSKDHLFVAAIHRMLGRTRTPSWKLGLVERILHFVDELKELHRLRAVMDERARKSAVVAEFVRALDEYLRARLAEALRPHVPSNDLPAAVDMFMATARGACQHEIDARARRRLLKFALGRILSPSSPPDPRTGPRERRRLGRPDLEPRGR
ncbi:MAG: TetR/AcrR family transcriptional regulator [Candidatus Binatia bacterium]